MRLTQHIGKAAREHAKEGGAETKRVRKNAKPRKSRFASLTAHRAFVPLVSIWAALLLGLVILVLPGHSISRISALTGISFPLVMVRSVTALLLAVAGGLLGFIIASALRGPSAKDADEATMISAFKSRSVRTIDPSADLGSESLDAPLDEVTLEEWQEVNGDDDVAAPSAHEVEDTAVEDADDNPPSPLVRKPTLGELSRRGYEMEAPEEFENEDKGDSRSDGWAFTRRHFKEALIESCEGATCEAADTKTPDTPKADTPEPANTEHENVSGKPRVLDLAEFGELPGRNAVWVEDQPEASSETAPSNSSVEARVPANASALEKLRQTPTDQLSLVEMVERFAAALHDHQRTERERTAAQPAQKLASRDAALAEALKALSLFTERRFDQASPQASGETQIDQTERDLRDALERLQDLRGAA